MSQEDSSEFTKTATVNHNTMTMRPWSFDVNGITLGLAAYLSSNIHVFTFYNGFSLAEITQKSLLLLREIGKKLIVRKTQDI